MLIEGKPIAKAKDKPPNSNVVNLTFQIVISLVFLENPPNMIELPATKRESREDIVIANNALKPKPEKYAGVVLLMTSKSAKL